MSPNYPSCATASSKGNGARKVNITTAGGRCMTSGNPLPLRVINTNASRFCGAGGKFLAARSRIFSIG